MVSYIIWFGSSSELLSEWAGASIPPTRVKEILDAENRETAGATAPPQGLVLVKIVYKKEENKRTDC